VYDTVWSCLHHTVACPPVKPKESSSLIPNFCVACSIALFVISLDSLPGNCTIHQQHCIIHQTPLYHTPDSTACIRIPGHCIIHQAVQASNNRCVKEGTFHHTLLDNTPNIVYHHRTPHIVKHANPLFSCPISNGQSLSRLSPLSLSGAVSSRESDKSLEKRLPTVASNQVKGLVL